MELTPMIVLRSLSRLALTSALFLTAQVALAQHDVGGGTTSGAATSSGESTTRRSTVVKRPARPTTSAVRRPRPPVRRGLTAEQINAQGDEFFKAEQYDEALEAYNKALQLKPIASAYYHIGWIYNDRDDFDQALSALQQAVRLNPNDADSYYELGFAYRNLKHPNEALNSYRQAIQVKGEYAEAYYQIGWIYNDQGQFAQAIEPYAGREREQHEGHQLHGRERAHLRRCRVQQHSGGQRQGQNRHLAAKGRNQD